VKKIIKPVFKYRYSPTDEQKAGLDTDVWILPLYIQLDLASWNL